VSLARLLLDPAFSREEHLALFGAHQKMSILRQYSLAGHMNEDICGRYPAKVAYFLTTCWMLAQGQGAPERKIPSSPGVLDQALWSLIRRGSLPDWVEHSLHFAMTPWGPRSSDLQQALRWAQGSGLLICPPGSEGMAVTLDQSAALLFLRDLNLNAQDAERYGKLLRDAIIVGDT